MRYRIFLLAGVLLMGLGFGSCDVLMPGEKAGVAAPAGVGTTAPAAPEATLRGAGGAWEAVDTAAALARLPAFSVLLGGDSTVSPYAATTVQAGWGMELGAFFFDKVTVDNKANGGRM